MSEEDPASKGGKVERSGGVQSLVRGFALLEEIARHEGGIGLADLAKQVGLHSSTAFHLVRTLVETGYARQSTETRRYHIGRMLFATAARALTEIELVSTSAAFLEELARDTGESAYLATRHGDEILVIAVVPGSGAVQLRGRAGSLRPAHATALGKVLLAALPPVQLPQLLGRIALPALTERTITDHAELTRELQRVRQTGIAFDDGEFDSEVRCMAAPVFNFAGQAIAALGVSGPAWRLKLQVVGTQVSKLRYVAGRLSADLGYQSEVKDAAAG